jgi:CAAX prenyl protease-like protein
MLDFAFFMFNKILSSPIFSRVIPFAAFAALTLLQGRFGDTSQYWIYALKTAIGAWLIWLMRPYVKEMRWKLSWEAAVVGVAVFLAWTGLEGHYPMLVPREAGFNPPRAYGAGSALALTFIVVRIAGSTLVVPPLEEVFYRSFVYRYLIKSDFLEIPLSHVQWRAFLIAGLIFGMGHYEWLPGILCAFAYQGLVCRKNRLGDAITAHAITNFLLGLWVVTHQAYYFW